MERQKKCRYCQKEFTAKRIDAMYCSDSCRQMGYRRQSKPKMYGRVVPIYFELDDHEYAEVLKKAEEEELHPNEYVKEVLIKKEDYLKIYFSDEEWSNTINPTMGIYPDTSFEKIVKDLFLKAANKEIEDYKE